MYGESLIHDQAARLVRGEALYQDYTRPPYTVAAYTPVYYVVVAAIHAIGGPGFTGGRVVSLVAGIAAAVLVGWLTAACAGAARAGWLAGLLFVAAGWGGGASPLGSLLTQVAALRSAAPIDPPTPAWAALYKEDVLGIALSLGAVALLTRSRDTWMCVVAGALAGMAILSKQTLLAATIAGSLWTVRFDRRAAVVYATTSISVVAVVAVALQIRTGAFIQNTVIANANPTSFDALTNNLKILVLFQAGLLIAAGLYVVGIRRIVLRRPRDARLLVALYWLAAMLPLVGMLKAGANYNYWIELAAPTAALATLAVWPRPGKQPLVPLVLVGANMGLLFVLLPGPLLRSSFGYANAAINPADFNQLIAEVRAEPRDVLAAPLDVVTLAGKRVLFEPYVFSIWFSTQQWDPAPLVQRICTGQVGLLVMDRPVEQPPFEFDGYSSWPAPVLAAMRQTAVFESARAGRYTYRLSRPCASPEPA
jgi:hypothetical protein